MATRRQAPGCTGARPSGAGRAVPDVGDVGAVRAVSDDIGLLDVPPPRHRRAQHAPAPAPLTFGDRAVVLAERGLQRILEVVLRLGIPPVHEPEHAPGEHRERQRDPATASVEVAPEPTPKRVKHRCARYHRSCLAGGPAQEEHRNRDVPVPAERLHRVGGVGQFGGRPQRVPPTLPTTHRHPSLEVLEAHDEGSCRYCPGKPSSTVISLGTL
jgi:hypothetical protein